MFTTLIVQPIFNLLAFIYSLIPGHNFGLAIILFTIVVRILMWPLIKKQLHQVKVMRKLQPELKRIKAEAKGDRRQESVLMMELYKERGVNPFASIGVLILQIPILIGLYIGLQKVTKDPSQMIHFAYPFIQDFSWMRQLAENISSFDETLFGIVDLSRSALGKNGVYWPAMIIVIASAVAQYFQSKQLTPSSKDARSLRSILKDAGKGSQADQSEVNAAVGRSTRFLLPALVFLFTVNIASALSLYWLVSGLVALVQQSIILREDETEMEAVASKKTTTITSRAKKAKEAEVVVAAKSPKKAKSSKRSKRRK
ncbi:MAG TPA: YidC/Oxa1 family membrane protein insertase [Candidatus Saccharimonadales bacterium]|nr:YidC/Oxa1 family membrane protein insertase [Candidatus Saccharimonadales bacterium]